MQKYIYSGFAAVAVLGMVLLVVATRLGPGVGGDATIYISSAQNLLRGNGLGLVGPRGEFRLLPYFPPFFSLVLSFFGLFRLDLVAAARWLNILCFGGSLWLAGLMLWKATRSALFSLLGGLVLAVSPVLIPVFSWAMSEPLSTLLGMAALAVLLEVLRRRAAGGPRVTLCLLLSAGLTGLAFLTRYNAVAFLGAAGIALLLFSRQTWCRRLENAILYGIVSSIPMLVWVVYDLSLTATVSSRTMLTSGSLIQRLGGFWQDFQLVLLSWIVPDSWIYSAPYPGILNRLLPVALLLGMLGWMALVAWRSYAPRSIRPSIEWERLFFLMLILAVIFLGVIISVKLTTYPPITINARMLSTLHVVFLILGVLLAYRTLEIWSRLSWLKLAMPAGVLLVVLAYGWNSIHITRQNAINGLGYYDLGWRTSQTMQAVRNLPADILIVTNQDMAVLALSGRASYPLKEIFADKPAGVFTRYGDGNLTNDEPQRLFRQDGAALVLFDSIDDQLASLYGDRTAERLQALVQGLYRYQRFEDGGIFFYLKPNHPGLN